MSSLPELYSRFTTRIVNWTLGPSGGQQLLPANPYRWSVAFIKGTLVMANVRVIPTIAGIGYIELDALVQPIVFDNRSYPGLPQSEWITDPSVTSGDLTVIETLQEV